MNSSCRQDKWTEQRRGLTLMEVVITIGIMAVVLSTVLTIIFTMQRTYFKTADVFSDTTERSLSDRVIWLNTITAGPSFNNLNQVDDNGRQFYDLFPDYPSKLIAPPAAQTRVLTLTNIGDSMVMLLFDKQSDPPVLYDPVRAYDSVLGGDVNTSGTLTYTGVNNNNYVTNLNPALFRANQMLMLYSPILLRPLGAAMDVAPRFTIYTGYVNGINVTANTGPAGVIRNTHPVTNAVIGNADEFFRTAPATGGSSQFVLVAGIRLIRYRMIAAAVPSGKLLQRTEWNGAAWVRPFPVAADINQIVFRRPSVSVPTIAVDMDFNY